MYPTLPSFTCGKPLSLPTSQCPDVTREEIANACGVDDLHDGINYTRTACVIAVARSQEMFEPLLHQVGGKGGIRYQEMFEPLLHQVGGKGGDTLPGDV